MMGLVLNERCILCGRTSPTGLHVLGCLICFSCERALLQPHAYRKAALLTRSRLPRAALEHAGGAPIMPHI